MSEKECELLMSRRQSAEEDEAIVSAEASIVALVIDQKFSKKSTRWRVHQGTSHI